MSGARGDSIRACLCDTMGQWYTATGEASFSWATSIQPLVYPRFDGPPRRQSAGVSVRRFADPPVEFFSHRQYPGHFDKRRSASRKNLTPRLVSGHTPGANPALKVSQAPDGRIVDPFKRSRGPLGGFWAALGAAWGPLWNPLGMGALSLGAHPHGISERTKFESNSQIYAYARHIPGHIQYPVSRLGSFWQRAIVYVHTHTHIHVYIYICISTQITPDPSLHRRPCF